ncbi:DUF4192 family protein [Microbacterium sp. zg-YB36]|uniref:DUF4192 family protein n=1 Tax=Microbacterium sp. zg-YB36 TaxID=2969407 RepID=UPI00214BC7A7|nr:DUF4192 family protein [Microbacterium sp. zg-YB36]MDL5350587.1 DUF4192 family protein [Microbacterium sp. zg-YB36]
MPNAKPHIQRNASTAELIAAMPSFTGVPVHNSVVVAPFWGKLTSSALRIDLPHEHTKSAYQRHAGALLAHLSRLDGCDRVAVAVYTDESYDAALRGWEEMLNHLLERIHGAGFHIAEAAIVAADGWGCFLDGATKRALAELEAAASRAPALPDRPALHTLPPVDPELMRTVSRHVVTRVLIDMEHDAFGSLHPAPHPEPIDHLERALAGDPDRVGPATLARIITLMQSEGAVDRTVLQIVFGKDVAAASWELTLATRERARRAGCEPATLLARDYLQGDRTGERFGWMLLGETDERPSAARLRKGALLLGRAIAHCNMPERVWAMCALGWIRWALGLTAAAEEMLDSAESVNPDNTMVPVYRTLVTHCIPAWIFDRAPQPALNRAARRAAARHRK